MKNQKLAIHVDTRLINVDVRTRFTAMIALTTPAHNTRMVYNPSMGLIVRPPLHWADSSDSKQGLRSREEKR